ncbi:MAG: DUF262 domain-containing protein [Candidatus Saccharibacteria bacterium]|nr:DUF262 domain-containing protein [Candidatus Saccharibacteria bacterium]
MSTGIFRNVQTEVGELTHSVVKGRIGLPDLQRPFVWQDRKVRELFDSMMKGYPIGYIMLWETPKNYEEHMSSIGTNKKASPEPSQLVIDGQQRLTALTAAMWGIKIKDAKFRERELKISFNPINGKFEVWSQAYERSPEWIPKISSLFLAKEDNSIGKLRRVYINNVNESRFKKGLPELTDEEIDTIENNISSLLNLTRYSLPAIEINYDASEEDVADIFVRVNSGGQKLNEHNFIQTLVSVYDNETSDKINNFCNQSITPQDGTAYNNLIKLKPSHLIRMTVGIGFRRARLHYAYMLLRGKDLATGEYSSERRNNNLLVFKDSLSKVTDINNWHKFLSIASETGYISKELITSDNALVYCYVLYLIGKYDYKVPSVKLRQIIRNWLFMSTITQLYTSGTIESEAEKQLNDLRKVSNSQEFVDYLAKAIETRFTDDYFNVTLPDELNKSGAQSPSWNGFVASQIVLGAPLLFSTTPIANFFTIGSNGKKKSIDKHHIFPKKYLEKIGISNDNDRNQIANFTFLDYDRNISISDKAPSEYIAEYKLRYSSTDFSKMCQQHALPDNFEMMEYYDFLDKRRRLMAMTVKQAYEKLSYDLS